MPPKKAKKGKDNKPKKEELPAIDVAFYELQITDLNRKLARLRSENDQVRSENNEYRSFAKSVETDRNDVIEHIKRMNDLQTEQIDELKTTLKDLEHEKEETASLHKKKIEEMTQEYKMMREALLAESSLLTGKLHSLEEFRIQRDELMKKFSLQEKQMEARLKAHNRLIYEMERKYIAGKNQLRREMEANLMQLSNDFHDSAELCIADTTRRVVRENIAVNNELNTLMSSMMKVVNDNNDLKEKVPKLKLHVKLLEEEKCKLFRQYNMQNRVLDRLAKKQTILTDELKDLKLKEKEAAITREALRQTTTYLNAYKVKSDFLMQKLECAMSEHLSVTHRMEELRFKKSRIIDIMKHAKHTVKATLALLEKSPQDFGVDAFKTHFRDIYCLLEYARRVDEQPSSSVDTLHSLERSSLTKSIECSKVTIILEKSSMELVKPMEEGEEIKGDGEVPSKSKLKVKQKDVSTSYSESSSKSSSKFSEKSLEARGESTTICSVDFAAPIDSVSQSMLSEDTTKEDSFDTRQSVVAEDNAMLLAVIPPDDGEQIGEEEEESIEEIFVEIDDSKTEMGDGEDGEGENDEGAD